MRTLQPTAKRCRATLPPRQPVHAMTPRTFAVRCVRCGRRFEVERAPATCRACGGVAVAG